MTGCGVRRVGTSTAFTLSAMTTSSCSLWIAFNAAYGLALLDPNVHAGSAKKEWKKLTGFLRKLSTETRIE